MQEILSELGFYHGLFLACLAGALIFAAVAAVVFLRTDTRAALEFLTGRKARKEIRRLEREADPDGATELLAREKCAREKKEQVEEVATEFLPGIRKRKGKLLLFFLITVPLCLGMAEPEADQTPPDAGSIRVIYTAGRELTGEEKEAAAGAELFAEQGQSPEEEPAENREPLFSGTFMEIVLYIHDEGQGTGLVEYSFCGEKGTALAEGETWIDGIRYEIVSLKVEREGGPGKLLLTGITDRAGNRTPDISEEVPLEGRRLAAVDRTAPSVRTECAAAVSEEQDRKYYGSREREGETLCLVFTEEYFEYRRTEDGEEVRPDLAILKDGERMSAEETEAWISWGDFENGEISAQITLPYEEGQEVSYQVEAVYQDAAGNPLVSGEGSFGELADPERGVFRTGMLVLDRKAPKLLSFGAEGNCVQQAEWEGEKIPLYQNREEADLVFAFSIEAEEDWQTETLRLQIRDLTEDKAAAEFQGNDERIRWTHEGRKHTAEFTLEGEEGKENVLQLYLSCQDRAGNLLADGRTEEAGEEISGEIWAEQGVFISTPFILDHRAPLLHVTYTEAERTVKDGKDVPDFRTPAAGCTSYYKEEIIVSIQIQDAFGSFAGADGESISGPENLEAVLIRETGGPSGNTGETDAGILWEKAEKGVWTGSLSIADEGDFRLRISYQDAAGNPVLADESEGNTVQGILENGCYESPLLVLDRTAPVISLCYSEEPAVVWQEKKFFNTPVSLSVKVEDRNFRVQEFKDSLLDFEAENSRGENIKEETAFAEFLQELSGAGISRSIWDIEFPLETDAVYRIPIAFTDLAGNPAVWEAGQKENSAVYMEFPVVDTKAPEEAAFSCDPGETVNYLPSGWLFSGEKMTLSLTGQDETAGIRMIRFVFTDENGEETVRSKSFQPSGEAAFDVEVPGGEMASGELPFAQSALDGENFRGTVRMELYDWAGNCTVKTRNCVVEGEERHKETAAAWIEAVTRPSRTVDGEDYYNSDAVFRLTLSDGFSGLRKIQYSAGSTLSGSEDYAAQAGADLRAAPSSELTCEFSRELTLDASANNQNDIRIWAAYQDHTGHEETAEYRCHIDVTAPEITVQYDQKEPVNGRYYAQPRTATVTVRERNFDERDVEFQITNTEGAMPEISGWSSSGSGDDTVHVCTVTFAEDGDYTFTLAFQDLAGNRAVYGQTDEFTIDRTAPELEVSWDNEDSRNGFYYGAVRTAFVTVREQNFDEELIHIEAAAEGDAENVSIPALSAWSHDGDRHMASIVFWEDGQYTLRAEGEDLAGNLSAVYEAEPFVIDQTPPQREIYGVLDSSANAGEVRPGIRYSDANYDPSGTEIFLTGYENGETEWKGSWIQLETGAELKMEDFPHIQEMDDMYTLRASVQDLAGNSSQAQILFSVNRFGSVYTLEAETEALAGKNGSFYTNQEQDIVLIETNVDTLEFREVICNHDGKLASLEEGRDYTVEERGESIGWKQYTYTIGKENFTEEGTYLLTIYSEDRADNASDTGSKGKTIEFAVDKTAPDILISGADDGGRYREGSREVTLDIQDNMQLWEVCVNLNGQKRIYTALELEESGGRIAFRIPGENRWQELTVTALDRAGNTARTETLRLLVTPNLLIQFLTNKPAFYTTAGILLILEGAVMWYLYARTKRGKNEKKEI